jgi:hypothetical protein
LSLISIFGRCFWVLFANSEITINLGRQKILKEVKGVLLGSLLLHVQAA